MRGDHDATAPTCRHATIEPLPILIAPDPILKARARPVGAGRHGRRCATLLPRMFATMYSAPGIGLAAPQVGVGLRLAVVDLMPDDKPTPIVLINPRSSRVSEELATREEGCLSLPGQYADVTRPARVKVRYLDLDRREAGDRGRRVCWPPACSTRSTTSTACCSSITCPR